MRLCPKCGSPLSPEGACTNQNCVNYKQELTAIVRYCPLCGNELTDEGVCTNRKCKAFGRVIAPLKEVNGEIQPVFSESGNSLFAIADRQLNLLLNDISKDSPASDWRMIQHVSYRILQEIATTQHWLCDVERDLRSVSMTNEQREKALSNLYRIGAWLEQKGNFASEINAKACTVYTGEMLFPEEGATP